MGERAMTSLRRFIALRKAEGAAWALAHNRIAADALCLRDEIDDAAHALFRVRSSVEHPGWEIVDGGEAR